MTSTGELDNGSVATTRAPELPMEGDDIRVIPAGAPDEPGGRHLAVTIAAALVSIGVVVAAIGVLTRHDRDSAQVAVEPSPSVPVQAPARPKAVTKTRLPSRLATAPHSTVPARSGQPEQTPVTGGHAVVSSPPRTAPAATVRLAPLKQFGAAALTWFAPRMLTIPAGRTASLKVVAFNHRDGVVNLPHPLSCTPRLDHTEVCVEMVQTIQPGGSATATYTIDARGVAPGRYSLLIEGALTIPVSVT